MGGCSVDQKGKKASASYKKGVQKGRFRFTPHKEKVVRAPEKGNTLTYAGRKKDLDLT